MSRWCLLKLAYVNMTRAALCRAGEPRVFFGVVSVDMTRAVPCRVDETLDHAEAVAAIDVEIGRGAAMNEE